MVPTQRLAAERPARISSELATGPTRRLLEVSSTVVSAGAAFGIRTTRASVLPPVSDEGAVTDRVEAADAWAGFARDARDARIARPRPETDA